MKNKKRPRGLAAAKTETMHEEDSATAGAVQSRERPILFSAQMVRAILAGVKGQTRRVAGQPSTTTSPTACCRYGLAGDRMWVRETFAYGYGLAEVLSSNQLIAATGARPAPDVIYQADGTVLPGGCQWRPSIFMPRAASRLSLEITAIRVERLQDISEQDALAEGVDSLSSSPVDAFRAVWDVINGRRASCSWNDNPLVHVINFSVIQAAAVPRQAGGAL